MKRKSILTALLLFNLLFVWAQTNTTKKPKATQTSQKTFFEIQREFEEYWEPFDVSDGYYLNSKGEKQKAQGWKQFKRWEYFWNNRVNQTTGTFPRTMAIDNYKTWKKTNPFSQAKSIQGNWQSLGPISTTGGYAGTGRINCIGFHPTDTNVYWVGSPSGGLWQTSNDGANWTVLTDGNDVLGVSDIAISSDYDNDQTIYIATGDRDGGSMYALGGGQSNDNNSIGVLKSTDSGITWNATSLSFTASQKRTINRLLIDPNNNSILYAATSVGLYKTIDSGSNWNQLSATEYISLEFKPGDATTLYAGNWNGDVYRSTDSGASFASVLTTTNNRVVLAVTANNSNVVYVLMDGSSKQGGIYKSSDGGASFSEVYLGTKNLLGWECDGSDSGDQGSYDLCIAADPTNANVVLIGGVNTWKSTNGGADWSINTHWSSTCGGAATTVHADKHFLAYQNASSTVFQCNDGGVYKSTNSGNSWSDKTTGIVASQMYRIGVSQTESNATITGLQDNGSKLIRSDGTWDDVTGGDGMECLIDYSDYQIQYSTYVQGRIYRTSNAWGGYSTIHSGTGNWVTPYVIDPNNHTTLYGGYANVEKSTDSGNSWADISTMNSGQKLRSLAVAPSDSNYIYTADPNQLWVTTNGGTSWTERTSGLPVASNAITYIAVKHDDPNTVWVTFGGYDSDRIYESIDAGQTWTNISTGLPDIPTMSVVHNKQNTTDVELYVSTDIGVYLKVGASNWQQYNTGLPNVVVNELDIYYDAIPENSRLRAGTSGRGLWETDLYTPPSGPMAYDSSTTTQDTTTDVYVGTANQEIIGVEIVTTGNENPIVATSFTFNTNGSTAANADLTYAKVYYTNNSANFATTDQFGSATANPDGSFTISGSQELISGTNHFWLAYDIDAAATGDNFIDAECTSITVDGATVSPSVTAPAGNRKIATCSVCASIGNMDWQTSTTLVQFNTISQSSTKPSGYSDYTATSTDVKLGSTHNLTVNVNTDGPYTVYTKVWIDWNHDCDFDDANEEYDLGSENDKDDAPTSNSPLAVTIPLDALLGNTTMRVSTRYGSAATSCETDFDGEVEDYTINVLFGCTGATTTWNGAAWDNGTPDSTMVAIINADYDTSTFGNVNSCSCTINAGVVLWINAGDTYTAQFDFENNGEIYIDHEGSFLQVRDDASVSGGGVFTTEKTTTPYHEYDYTYFSSPSLTARIDDTFADNIEAYSWNLVTANMDGINTDGDDWTQASGVMVPGIGYAVLGAAADLPFDSNTANWSNANQDSVNFDGPFNTGTIPVVVVIDAEPEDNTFNNQNLIGNPYPSAIDLHAFYNANDAVLGPNFHFWTHNSAISDGNDGSNAYNFTNNDYSTWNAGTGAVVGGSATGKTSQYVASGQGFLAEAADLSAGTPTGVITFTNAMRVAGNNTNLLNPMATNKDRLWLNMKGANGDFRQILVGFFEAATAEFDEFYDAPRMENGNSTDFYSLIQPSDRHFAIQGLGSFHSDYVIPLGIEIVQAGEYRFEIDHSEGVFASDQNIFIFDNYTNTYHNLKQASFSFTTAIEAALNDRFEIRFTDETTATTDYLSNYVVVYPNPTQNTFTISWRGSLTATIDIIDLAGKLIWSKKGIISENKTYRVNTSTFVPGVYFVKLHANDRTMTRKLIIK